MSRLHTRPLAAKGCRKMANSPRSRGAVRLTPIGGETMRLNLTRYADSTPRGPSFESARSPATESVLRSHVTRTRDFSAPARSSRREGQDLPRGGERRRCGVQGEVSRVRVRSRHAHAQHARMQRVRGRREVVYVACARDDGHARERVRAEVAGRSFDHPRLRAASARKRDWALMFAETIFSLAASVPSVRRRRCR